MNDPNLNIADLPKKKLPILSQEEAGEQFNKWSYLYVYHLSFLRDVYLLTQEVENKNLKNITIKINQEKVAKNDGEQWEPLSERQVLEYLTALVKFKLLDNNYNRTRDFFVNSRINTNLTDKDKKELSAIFFTYFRFKELSSWFIDTSVEFHKNFAQLEQADFIYNSKPLFFYSDKSRFNNVFIDSIEKPDYQYLIDDNGLMRFWDVYLKWGVSLNIIERFNISEIITFLPKRSISIAYFIREFKEFDLPKFISKYFSSKTIWIPELILLIARKYRYSVPVIKEFIISNIIHNDRITFERTSEIFLIKGKTKTKAMDKATYLYPLADEFYISHLILRK